MARSLVFALLAMMATSTGCATLGNTPAQDLAWERWRACDHFATISLERIDMDGRLVVAGHHIEAAAFTTCVGETATEQARRGVVAAGPLSLVLVKLYGCQGGPL